MWYFRRGGNLSRHRACDRPGQVPNSVRGSRGHEDIGVFLNTRSALTLEYYHLDLNRLLARVVL